jgi:hypothetical protein
MPRQLLGQLVSHVHAVGECLDLIEMRPCDPLVLFHDDPCERPERLAELRMLEQMVDLPGLILSLDSREADVTAACAVPGLVGARIA